MEGYVKYPRTPHLPFSPGVQKDDAFLLDTRIFENQEVIVTEKMDGENITMYSDHLHARSLDSGYHWSRERLYKFHAEIAHLIPENFRVCGENLVARHSIKYANLPHFFLGFSVWESQDCLSWDDTVEWFELLGIRSVPVIWRGVWDEHHIKNLIANLDLNLQEGIVVRRTGSFQFEDFAKNVAKWVRKDHVGQNRQHWMNALPEENHWLHKKP
jgi:ATP-dependent RNA circularization protein (DNA/RNA ligase family)